MFFYCRIDFSWNSLRLLLFYNNWSMLVLHVQNTIKNFKNKSRERFENSVTLSTLSNAVASSHLDLQGKGSFAGQTNRKKSDQLGQAVLRQSLLYVAVGTLCTIPAAILKNIPNLFGITRVDESSIYWLSLLATITLPSTGAFNLLVFTRPT